MLKQGIVSKGGMAEADVPDVSSMVTQLVVGFDSVDSVSDGPEDLSQ